MLLKCVSMAITPLLSMCWSPSEALLLFVWYSQVWSIMEMATLGHPLGPHLHPSHRKAYQCAFSCLTLLIWYETDSVNIIFFSFTKIYYLRRRQWIVWQTLEISLRCCLVDVLDALQWISGVRTAKDARSENYSQGVRWHTVCLLFQSNPKRMNSAFYLPIKKELNHLHILRKKLLPDEMKYEAFQSV